MQTITQFLPVYLIGCSLIGTAHIYNYSQGHFTNKDNTTKFICLAMTLTWPVSGPYVLWKMNQFENTQK